MLAPPPYGPSLGLLETASIARGIVVCDALVKRAAVRILVSEPVTPGKFLILFDGGEAEVDESMKAAAEAARDSLVDKLLLALPHEQLWGALQQPLQPAALESVGVVETLTIAATLAAADAAVKAADVTLFRLHLARGIGGKGWFALTGPLHMVEAAVEAATRTTGAGLLAGVEVIAAPHDDLGGRAL